ncbi:excinuclease ABC subunit C [candidate division KSB1 bacterium]|nr:excinuclease ABC subunit C [candidate division KSB1 bacterium]NIR72558.1 excinuclease ABC subunit C [candidate division KSB1 bacterium]NIS27310.1 excinuclease ABC subunit C [candidate division KSB1 bacterium]NIT73520.1 excinuclease ABC subunit C [candidate division KSB1 bacterium]NIU28040.1 excinuclease ABC subunit C [candidate division KSB1 bacterium]
MPASQRQDLQEKLQNLAKKPGCYLFKDKKGKIIYVGKAKSLNPRVRSYFQNGRLEGLKLERLKSKIVDFDTIVTDTEMEALILEMNLIKEYKPRYNINLKDDKSYPYIRVTNERFPRIFPTRKIVRDGSRYFGPYTDVGAMRNLLKSVKRIFPIRSCNYDLTEQAVARKKYKLCLDYYIKKCDGPCEGLVSEDDYKETVEQIIRFINGKNNQVVLELREKMSKLAQSKRYEEAARVRDQIKSIENFQFKQKVVTDELKDRDIVGVAREEKNACGVVLKVRDGKILGRQHFYLDGVEQESFEDVVSSFLKQFYLKADFLPQEIYLPVKIDEFQALQTWLSERREHKVKLIVPQKGQKAKLVKMASKNAMLLLEELELQKQKAKDSVPHNVQALKRDLRLRKAPRRIECFDISNIQGTNAVASMVTFVNGKPKKGDYRKFKITVKDTPDDFAMMAEAVRRRYSGSLVNDLDNPDLILVDGGKGQLSTARQVLKGLNKETQPIAALAKRLDEVFLPSAPEPQNIPKTSSGLKLLQHIRDEAHRFAITYHRTLRKKQTTQSALDTIPGIGPTKRRALVVHFGSVKNIKEAMVDELQMVEGITPALAKKIWETFHFVDANKHSNQ